MVAARYTRGTAVSKVLVYQLRFPAGAAGDSFKLQRESTYYLLLCKSYNIDSMRCYRRMFCPAPN